MHMSEKWERWEPIQGLAQKYYIESIIDIIGIFKILLCDAQDRTKKVLITFEKSIDIYRLINENARSHTLSALQEQYGANFYETWTFFRVTNSSYVKWLSEQSYQLSDVWEFQHLAFVGMNSTVDVINTYNPKIEFLND